MSLTQSTLVLIKLKCFLSSHCILPPLTPPFTPPVLPVLSLPYSLPTLSFQQSFITFNDLVSWEVQPVYIHLFTDKKTTFNSQHIGILPRRLQWLWCKWLAMYVKPGADFQALCRVSQVNTENMQCNLFFFTFPVDTFCIVSNAGGVTSFTVSIMTHFVQFLLGFQITWL